MDLNGQFFFVNNNKPVGPFTLDELLEKDISSKTFIWSKGMTNWEKIESIPVILERINNNNNNQPPVFIEPKSEGDNITQKGKGVQSISSNGRNQIGLISIIIILTLIIILGILLNYKTENEEVIDVKEKIVEENEYVDTSPWWINYYEDDSGNKTAKRYISSLDFEVDLMPEYEGTITIDTSRIFIQFYYWSEDNKMVFILKNDYSKMIGLNGYVEGHYRLTVWDKDNQGETFDAFNQNGTLVLGHPLVTARNFYSEKEKKFHQMLLKGGEIILLIQDLNRGSKGNILFQARMNANNFDRVYYQLFENSQ